MSGNLFLRGRASPTLQHRRKVLRICVHIRAQSDIDPYAYLKINLRMLKLQTNYFRVHYNSRLRAHLPAQHEAIAVGEGAHAGGATAHGCGVVLVSPQRLERRLAGHSRQAQAHMTYFIFLGRHRHT